MDKIQHDKLITDDILRTSINKGLFIQWLKRFFYLNHALNKEYDSIYQGSFYVVFYELVTVGLEYSKGVLTYIDNSENLDEKEFYTELVNRLKKFKSEFSESELEFIEYKRHGFSHIFQNTYENRILDNGKIQTKRKGKLIDELNSTFKEIMLKYGFDRGFDEYVMKKLYPKISELYNKLERINALQQRV